jgi:hypothetical protein
MRNSDFQKFSKQGESENYLQSPSAEDVERFRLKSRLKSSTKMTGVPIDSITNFRKSLFRQGGFCWGLRVILPNFFPFYVLVFHDFISSPNKKYSRKKTTKAVLSAV